MTVGSTGPGASPGLCPAAEWIEVPCELCGSATREAALTQPPWTWQRCGACSHLYLSPRPTDAALLRLRQEALPTRVPDIEAVERRSLREGAAALAALRRAGLRAGARVLDPASGFGFFLAGLRAAGYDPIGFEGSTAARTFASRWLGESSEAETDAGWERHAGSCDAVVAFDALAHTAQLRPWLSRVHRVLRPGGWLLAAWHRPLAWTRAAQAFGIRMPWPRTPGPLREFSTTALTRVLTDGGFVEVRHVRPGWLRPGRPHLVLAVRPV